MGIVLLHAWTCRVKLSSDSRIDCVVGALIAIDLVLTVLHLKRQLTNWRSPHILRVTGCNSLASSYGRGNIIAIVCLASKSHSHGLCDSMFLMRGTTSILHERLLSSLSARSSWIRKNNGSLVCVEWWSSSAYELSCATVCNSAISHLSCVNSILPINWTYIWTEDAVLGIHLVLLLQFITLLLVTEKRNWSFETISRLYRYWLNSLSLCLLRFA